MPSRLKGRWNRYCQMYSKKIPRTKSGRLIASIKSFVSTSEKRKSLDILNAMHKVSILSCQTRRRCLPKRLFERFNELQDQAKRMAEARNRFVRFVKANYRHQLNEGFMG